MKLMELMKQMELMKIMKQMIIKINQNTPFNILLFIIKSSEICIYII